MNIIRARQETLDGGAIVYSHPSIITPNEVIVRVIDTGIEVVASAPTRAEALEHLADHFREISQQLRHKAWLPDANKEAP